MNIYKTKSGCYINMDQIKYIHTYGNTMVAIYFESNSVLELTNDEAKAFLNYLNRHLNTVFEGYA